MKDSNIKTLEGELLASFRMYADAKYNENLLPISRIIFSAQGEITSPPDLEFMGYGFGPEGEPFESCGGINLAVFFPLNDEDYYRDNTEACFYKASAAVLSALQLISKSDDFLAMPKRGPIVFALNLIDQVSQLLCRIHPDGILELPPEK